MPLGDILGAAGILATTLFGIWGVVLVIRHRYPGRITLVKESCIGLFDAIVKNLPELRVLYNNAPVGTGLVLFKGVFANTGSKDISPEMVEQRLALDLPKDYRWLTARIVQHSPELQAKFEIQNNCITVEIGLFRKGELIRFEAVAEVSVAEEKREGAGGDIADAFWRSLAITSRIADTQAVEKIDLRPGGLGVGLIAGIIVLAAGPAAFVNLLEPPPPVPTAYMVQAPSGQFEEVEINLITNGLARIKGVKNNTQQTLPITNIFELHPRTDRSISRWPFLLIAVIAVMVLVLGTGSAFALIGKRRDRRLRKLLKGEMVPVSPRASPAAEA